MQVTKYVLPVVVGAMAGMILIILGRNWIELYYPLLPGTDKYDGDSMAKAITMLPEAAFKLYLLNGAVCSLIAGGISAAVAGRTELRPSLIVGIFLTLAGAYEVVNYHFPVWYKVLNLAVCIPLACAGYLIIKKKATIV